MIDLTSPAFADGGTIAPRYAMKAIPGGENVSMPFAWSGEPGGTKSFALAIVDRSPVAHDWVHWLVVDIPGGTVDLLEGASGSAAMPLGSRELSTSFGSQGYGGPQPPPGTGPHPYEATLYALDTPTLPLPHAATLREFEQAVAPHTLASGRLIGVLGRWRRGYRSRSNEC